MCVPRRVQYSQLFAIRIRLKIYAPILIRYETSGEYLLLFAAALPRFFFVRDFRFRYLYFSWEKNYVMSPNDELHLHVSARIQLLRLKHKCFFFFFFVAFAVLFFLFNSIRLTNNNKTFFPYSSIDRYSSGRNGSTNFVCCLLVALLLICTEKNYIQFICGSFSIDFCRYQYVFQVH